MPISPKLINRVLIVSVVILAVAAGFYRSALEAEQKKYKYIEDKYVRVRSVLGVEETQRLIEESYKLNE